MTSLLTLENPVFVAYAVAAALMVLKIMGQGWMTVVLMTRFDAGLMSPWTCARHPSTGTLGPTNWPHTPMWSARAACTATTWRTSQPSSQRA